MSTTNFELPSQPAIPYDVSIVANPTQAELRALTLKHTPFVQQTAAGSLNKVSRNKSRVANYTYVIDRHGDPTRYSTGTIAPEKAEALIKSQAEYIKAKGQLIEIDGYVGMGPKGVAVQWLYTLEGANIAAMQQILAFPRKEVETAAAYEQPFRPALRLVYTPDHFVDMPGRQAIIVDLENYVTYVMGADYFGESKKGALRMLTALIYKNGGLLMHAGAKSITTGASSLVMGILGLSGTGKTTTTFSRQGERTAPVQDDMIAMWPGGDVTITENGCFAKTWALTDDTEPVIYRGTMSPDAWLENVYVDENGAPIFDKGLLSPAEVARMSDVLIGTGADPDNVAKYARGEVKAEALMHNHLPRDGWDFIMWSENGRSIVPMSAIEDAAPFDSLPPLRSLGILNRDEGPDAATPGLVRFVNPAQSAAYMMLGETTKTSAAGKERGKTRSPFTQPFFPLAHSLQARRFSELAATFPETAMWMMNTGYIAGDARSVVDGDGLKVKIRHSSAMLEALISDAIRWVQDPDFGYEIVDVDHPENRELLDKVPAEILQPRRWFEAKGKLDVYNGWVEQMKKERRAFLRKFEVDESIIDAIG